MKTEQLRAYFKEEPESEAAVERLGARLRLLSEEGLSTVLITSAWPSEGKSSLTLHLAFHLADAGLEVLLVDADLRKPTLSVLLEARSRGLAENLLGAEVAPSRLEQRLRLLPAGLETRAASQRLTAECVRPLAQTWKGQADLVLVDGSPMSVAPDAGVIAGCMDGVVFVVSKSRFRGGPEANFVEDLRDIGVRVVGSVIVGYRDAIAGRRLQGRVHQLLRWLGLLR